MFNLTMSILNNTTAMFGDQQKPQAVDIKDAIFSLCNLQIRKKTKVVGLIVKNMDPEVRFPGLNFSHPSTPTLDTHKLCDFGQSTKHPYTLIPLFVKLEQ